MCNVASLPETVAPTGRVRVRFQDSFCRADLVLSRQKMTHTPLIRHVEAYSDVAYWPFATFRGDEIIRSLSGA